MNKRKIIKLFKKIIIVLAVFVFSFLGISNLVYAIDLNAANVYSVGVCGDLLRYKGIVVKVSYVQYSNNGVEYPAYCLDKTKPGAETVPYSVSVNEAIKDVGLWRRIINGYPYKSIQELGVANKEEAFTATKQVIYCYIHGNNIADYEGIGEAGQRTLNAMYQIIRDAENNNSAIPPNNVTINKDSNIWVVDENEREYVSKQFSVKGGASDGAANVLKYKIKIKRNNSEDIGGIKVINSSNIEKEEFTENEKFKVLVPIREMKENGSFQIEAYATIGTKPVLYGIAPNSGYQDYALTAATYEEGMGITSDEFPQNETKIIVIKQDEETKKRLEGVNFEILNENKELVYNRLVTNSEGEIIFENLIPGKYYLKEVSTIDGYQRYEELIEFELTLHEQITIIVNNKKEEKPEIKIEKKEKVKEVSKKDVKKLPVAGW